MSKSMKVLVLASILSITAASAVQAGGVPGGVVGNPYGQSQGHNGGHVHNDGGKVTGGDFGH